MDYVFIPREGDREHIQQLSNSYVDLPDEDFISAFNAAARPGITGVHAQAVTLVAQHREFLRRFGKSPMTITSNSLLSLDNAKLTAKDGGFEALPVIWVANRLGPSDFVYLDHLIELRKPYIDITPFLKKGKTVLIERMHRHPNTIIDLGNGQRCNILFFNENGFLLGATHTSGKHAGNFQVITSRECILMTRDEWIVNPVYTNYFYFPKDKRKVTDYI